MNPVWKAVFAATGVIILDVLLYAMRITLGIVGAWYLINQVF